MEMNAEQAIAASRDRVWAALNDPEVLKASIPGCESFEETGENAYKAKIQAKVGPVKAKFDFAITLSDLNPPVSYTINGEGKGGPAGFANGSATVSLSEDGADTLLSYKVQARIGGKLMQLGARLIDATANKLAAEFFNNFSAIVAGDNGDEDESESATGLDVAPDPVEKNKNPIPLWLWPVILALILIVVYRFFV